MNNNSTTKVCIMGNSVPLLVQPFRDSDQDRTYPEILSQLGYRVINAVKQSAVITDTYHYFEDECTRFAPDYIILHFGIVEATFRARTRWIQNLFSLNAWNNSVIQMPYRGPIIRGVLYITKQLYKKIERLLFAIHIKWRWVSPSDFRFALRDISKRLFADTPTKKIILIGMIPIADWMERKSPGTRASIEHYNAIMKSVAAEYKNILYLDVASAYATQNTATISPDGVHFTGAGHRWLADLITPLLTGERVNYRGWTEINQYDKLYAIYAHWNKRSLSKRK